MAVAVRDCPYCKARRVAFTAQIAWNIDGSERRALFLCGSCFEGIILDYAGGGDIVKNGGNIDISGFVVFRQWPEAVVGHAPPDTPPIVANYFEQATASLNSAHFDAAGLMFRKSLETATKILDENLSKLSLYKRIDALVESNSLTKDMGDWAHEVRLGGNEAAHDDEPYTLEQAEELRGFIESFLRYAFTLPSAVKKRAKH
ncbi:DUF4145 domain-containing protein [Blastomonas fulva]|uniref:DUF4145 domain-containing protein n=1 Tax=Blastomonas fulva TaxID=1550728 RepID=UPI003F6F87B3